MPADKENGNGLLGEIRVRAESIATGMADLVRRVERNERGIESQEARLRATETTLADRSIFSRLEAVEKVLQEKADQGKLEAIEKRMDGMWTKVLGIVTLIVTVAGIILKVFL